MVQVKLSTLTDRAKGRHDDWKSGFAKRQLLTPAQEKTLVQWAKHQAEIGLPYSVQDLRIRAAQISGKKVGVNWTLGFEKRNPQLHAAKPVNLDPKRAKNFNQESFSGESRFATEFKVLGFI
jgi:Tc5 transposase DNA-binding domain